MKVAIFGGTFDPFTTAHAAIVKKLFNYVGVDKVVISPTITDWYRNNDDKWLTDEQRVEVCDAAADFIKQQGEINMPAYYSIAVNSYDIDAKHSFETPAQQEEFAKNYHYYDTLVNLRTIYKMHDANAEFFTVIGSDQLEFFKNWYRWEDILKLSKLLVVNYRNGNHVESDIQHIDIQIDKEFWNVSATDVRAEYKNIKNGLAKYIHDFFTLPEKEVILQRTPIFDLVQKPAPYADMPKFKPVGINAPDWVTVIAEKDGKYCCVKQLRFGLMKECEEFIAGQVDPNENGNPIYTAKRELLEETGIHLIHGVADLVYLGCLAANPAFMNNYMHYFYVNLDKAEWVQEKTKLDEHEVLECYWKDKHDVVNDYLKAQTSVFMAGGFWLLDKKLGIKL